MRKVFLATFLLFVPFVSQADSDSELRAEILGEQGGKAIATDDEEYQPEEAMETCGRLFSERWVEHFKEQGFDTDEATSDSFVAGCMKEYKKKFGED